MAHYDDGQVTFLLGDVRDVLREMPAESVNMCVTSPPYWGLRDYGTATWEGGDAECDHKGPRGGHLKEWSDANGYGGANKVLDGQTRPYRDVCGKCGAKRIDQQLGLERTPDCGRRGMFRLRTDLTGAEREFVVRYLLGEVLPDA